AAMYESWESLRSAIYDRFRNTADRCWQRSCFMPTRRMLAAKSLPALLKAYTTVSSIETIRHGRDSQQSQQDLLPLARASCCYPRPSCGDEVTIPPDAERDPNLYCRRMLAHLFNVFVPRRDLTGARPFCCSVWRVSTVSDVRALVDRGGSGGARQRRRRQQRRRNILGSGGGGAVADDGLRYQLTVCKNVLLKCVEITEKSRIITPETWETILEFLLIVNDVILTEPRDSKEQSMALRQHSLEDSKRSKSSVNTFKEALAEDHWAEQCKTRHRRTDAHLATSLPQSFPEAAAVEKTFRELLAGWRHHEEVAAKWGDAVREAHRVSSRRGEALASPAVRPTSARLSSSRRRCPSSSADILSRRHPVEDSAARSRQLPAIFNQLVCVLSDVASQLLGARRQQKQHGNSLLHLIGSWLFDCAGVSDPAYQAGPGRGLRLPLPAFCQLPARLSARLLGQDSISNLPSGVPTPVDLQRSAVRLLLSMIALPNHLANRRFSTRGQSVGAAYIPVASTFVVLVLDTLLLLRDSHCVQMLLCALLCIAEDFGQLREFGAQRRVLHGCRRSRAVPKAPDSVQKLFTQAVAAICKRLNLEHDSAPEDGLRHHPDCIGRVEPPGQTANRTAQPQLLRGASEGCVRLFSTKTGGAHSAGRTTRRTCLKSCVRWLCDFISSQCARPRQEHSRYLHSQIVATYDCLAQWALNYPQLLLDEDTLICLLEIIELGLSGSKSRVEHRGEATRFEPKWRKQKSPHSARLAQAAECLLSLIMSQVGRLRPPALGPQTAYGSLLTEESFPDCRRSTPETLAPHQIPGLKWLANPGCAGAGQPEAPTCHQPSLSSRPFGRQVWQAEMRDAPRQQRPPAAPQSARRPPPDPSLLPYWCYTEGAGRRRIFLPSRLACRLCARRRLGADAGFVTPNSAEVLRLMAQARVPKRLPLPSTRLGQRVPTGQAHLTQLGLLDIACTLDSSTQEFFDQLSELDGLPVRSLHPAALYFLRRRRRVRRFHQASAHGLGWPRPICPAMFAYWSDAVAEVVFHRPSGRPLEQSQPVLVWLEDVRGPGRFSHRCAVPASRSAGVRGLPRPPAQVLEVSMGPNANCKPPLPLDFGSAACSKAWLCRCAPRACLVRQAILNWVSPEAPSHGTSVRWPFARQVQQGSPDPRCEPFPHTISASALRSRFSAAAVNLLEATRCCSC
uniref:Urb2 domain-containing protein n=1 Tax=Macrostomum lignano TaxID=282301 RepID=A0A1I8JRZ2_9PLAT